MNKNVLMIAAALLLGTMAFAQAAGPKGGGPGGPQGQGKGGGMMRGQGMMQVETKVFGQLGLSAAQKTKVTALQKSRTDKFKAMRDKMKAGGTAGQQPDRTKMMAAFKKISDDYQAGLKSTLSAAQYKKYQDLMKSEMDKWRKDHPRGQGGPGGKPGAAGGKKPPL